MKKKLLSLIFALMLIFGMTSMAFAQGDTFVFDEADILTASELAGLQAKAQSYSQTYGVNICIAVVKNMGDYGYKDIEKFSEDYGTQNNIGAGSDNAYILLALDLNDRWYDLNAHGTAGHYAFTDYGKEVLAECFLDDFRYDDWFEGFDDYIDQAAHMLALAEQGRPLDVKDRDYSWNGEIHENEPLSLAEKISAGLSVGTPVGLLFALLRGLGLKGSMKSVRAAQKAGRYVENVQITNSRDVFTHRTVSRTPKSTSSSGGSHHSGGTHISSSGHSHHSGHF